MNIRPLVKEDSKAVTDLLNKHLSFGISNEERVLGFLEDGTSTASVLLDNDNNIIGFLQGELVGQNPDWDRLGFKEIYLDLFTGYLDKNIATVGLVVVEPEYRGQGCMMALVTNFLKEVRADYITAVSWIQNPSQMHMLEGRAERYLIAQQYWKEDNYPCGICGERCTCDALLWIGSVEKLFTIV